jgi:hypothetical protein
MSQLRVHAAVAAQAHQMQPAPFARVFIASSSTGFYKNSPELIIRSMRVTSM